MNTVSELIDRLRSEADSLEDCGQSEIACGIIAAVRILKDELNPFDTIGGDNAPPAQQESNHELVAELSQVKAECERANARYNRLMSVAGAIEADKQAVVEVATGHMLTLDRFKEVKGEIGLVEREIVAMPTCKKCKGGGSVRPMFEIRECPDCFGTGCDIGQIDKLVIAQQSVIRSQRVLLSDLLQELYLKGFSESMRNGLAVDAFYANSRTELRLD